MQVKKLTRALAGAGFVSLALLGCNSGGGGSTATTTTPVASTVITGTVAAGAPMIGSVTVKDSLGATKTKNIELDGKYSVDVSGMTAPFVFKAVGSVGGRNLALVSAATSADVGGTINITPFTDLIVANIAGMVAEQFFDNGNPNANAINNTGLKQATDNLTTRLAPVLQQLGVSASLDLLRTAFNADRTGIDKVMDVVKVTVNPETLTAEIKNIVENTTITDNLADKVDATVITATPATGTGATAAITALQAIENGLTIFSTLFATGLPSPTNPTLQALVVASGFLDGGNDRDTWINDITTDQGMIGIKFKNPAILSTSDNGNKMRIGFAVSAGSGGSEVEQVALDFWKNSTGAWQIAGDQQHAWHDLEPVVSRGPDWRNMSQQTNLPIGNRFDRHLDLWTETGNQDIVKIKIVGTGLRTGGLNLLRSTTPGTNSFDIENYNNMGSWLNECEDGITPDTAGQPPQQGFNGFDPGQCVDFTNVTSATTYTFTYYDVSNNVIGTHTQKLVAAPVAKSVAATNFDKWFPKITGVTPSMTEASNIQGSTTLSQLTNGTNVRVTWTAPTDATYKLDYIWMNIGGVSLEADGWNTTLTSPTLVGTWSGASPVVNGFIHLGVSTRDSAGRQFVTQEVTARLP